MIDPLTSTMRQVLKTVLQLLYMAYTFVHGVSYLMAVMTSK